MDETVLSLEQQMPDVYRQLLDVRDRVENHFRDMCDIEFTIENGRLFILNVRPGKRTPRANLVILLQFLSEGKIGIRDVLARVRLADVENCCTPEIHNLDSLRYLGQGLPACGGAATGEMDLSPRTRSMDVRGYGRFEEGEWLTFDGTTGRVYAGKGDVSVSRWQDNPGLSLLAQITDLSIKDDDVPLEAVGRTWKLRDFFAHNIPLRRVATTKRASGQQHAYVSFTQPSRRFLNVTRQWFLDYTNPNGEGLVTGANAVNSYLFRLNDARVCLTSTFLCSTTR